MQPEPETMSTQNLKPRTYTAQVPHTCSTCGGEIPPGAEYIRVVEIHSGQAPDVAKIHLGPCDRPSPPKRYGKK